MYLRTSFKTNTDFVPLEKELEHIRNYLDIEEARFSKRLEVIYTIDSSVKCDVPPLILQPLVENALKHGLSDKSTGGLLTIKVENSLDSVLLSVSDNGKGITKERLDLIHASSDEISGIGLKNVMNRIHSIYNTDLCILSDALKGTTIQVKIPHDKTIQGGNFA
jgi:two-component system sensor histidine kinase LytS